MEKELAIIGGGIAGVSCALYAKRAGITPVVFEKTAIGGQLAYINRVDNYPGIKMGMKGVELLEVLKTSLEELDIEVIGEEVRNVKEELTERKIVGIKVLHDNKESVTNIINDIAKIASSRGIKVNILNVNIEQSQVVNVVHYFLV